MAPRVLLLFLFLVFFFTTPPHFTASAAAVLETHLPLSTSGRWIINTDGRRVKLACANWVGHLEVVAPEGLQYQPLDDISKKAVSMGFNCIRLTWATYFATNATLGSITFRNSLLGLGLKDVVSGVAANNPTLLDLPLIQVFQAVVSNLASNQLMVILDNHLSKPMWCCSRKDGNGYFGDQYFNPDEWLQGLKLMATLFKNSTNVVGMSLRNELRGTNPNVADWYTYMQKGAEVAHEANSNVLVILSGLDFDKDLSFLAEKQVELSFTGKLVFELHWYGFADGGNWGKGTPGHVCETVVSNINRKGNFLLTQGWPVVFSEFGVDTRGDNIVDNRFLDCFLSTAAELDFDWAVWALQGSYYFREGQLDVDEVYGMLTHDWNQTRNSTILQRIAAIQSPTQGPGISKTPYNVIFHPLTGMCVRNKSLDEPLELGPCVEPEARNYMVEDETMLQGSGLCLQAEGIGKSVKLGTNCSDSSLKWKLISDSNMRIASKLPGNGSTVCLDLGLNRTLVANLCKCLSGGSMCDPTSQWFKIISSHGDTAAKLYGKP